MSLRHLQNISPYMHYKTIVLLFIVFSITCTLNMFSPIYAQQQQQGVNWLEICRNPMIDALITEPCESLTSPDGYTLTPQGEHALACIGGGALTLLISQPELLALRDAVGCGGNSGSNSSSSTTTPSDKQEAVASVVLQIVFNKVINREIIVVLQSVLHKINSIWRK